MRVRLAFLGHVGMVRPATEQQVDRDFEGSLSLAHDQAAEQGVKRKWPGADPFLKGVKQSVRARQRSWLRGLGGKHTKGAAGWRPKAVPRKSAYRWLLATDNQLQRHSTWSGWKAFEGPSAEDIRSGVCGDPLVWPLCTVACDRGSDGVAALNWLQRAARCNIEEAFDASHDAWRDMQRMLRETGLSSFWYLLLICINVLQGPFLESGRFNGVQEAIEEIWQHFSPKTCELWSELGNQVLWEAGRSQEVGSEEVLSALWEELRQDSDLRRKRYKVTSNRFFHSCEVGWVYARSWSKFRYVHTYLALENGSLTAASVGKLFVKPPSQADGTRGQQISPEEMAIRGRINALSCSVVFLSDRSRLLKLRCILCAQAPLENWFRWQNHWCRSVKNNASWLIDQVKEKFMAHITEIWGRLIVWPVARVCYLNGAYPRSRHTQLQGRHRDAPA